MDYAQFGAAVGTSIVVIVGGMGVLMKWSKIFGKNGSCPDPECHSKVAQTYDKVDVLQNSIFGEDGRGGMNRTLIGVEFCVKELAKKSGITPQDDED